LSTAVAAAGGLGLLGGGYGDRSWVEAELAKITRTTQGTVSLLGLSTNDRTCSPSHAGDVVRRVVDEAVGRLDQIRGLTVLDTTLRQATVKLLSFDADVTGRPSTKPWITLMLVSLLATTSSPASGTNDVVMGYQR